jgi:hypothetical protein
MSKKLKLPGFMRFNHKLTPIDVRKVKRKKKRLSPKGHNFSLTTIVTEIHKK